MSNRGHGSCKVALDAVAELVTFGLLQQTSFLDEGSRAAPSLAPLLHMIVTPTQLLEPTPTTKLLNIFYLPRYDKREQPEDHTRLHKHHGKLDGASPIPWTGCLLFGAKNDSMNKPIYCSTLRDFTGGQIV